MLSFIIYSCTGLAPGVRLSLGSAPGTLSVTWQTDASLQHPTLSYGKSPDSLESVVAADLRVLPNLDTTAAIREVFVFNSTMKVDFGATVFYRVSGDNRTFNMTQRTPQGIRAPATFALFGDLGIKEQEGANYTLARLLEHHARRDFDMVLHVGDIAYDLRDNGGRTGDEFTANLEPISSQLPYQVCPGNHERDCPQGEACDDPAYTNYRARFRMPNPTDAHLDASHQPMWWSADVGFAHVVAINTDVYSLGGQLDVLQAQWQWLQSDLQAAVANRHAVPWIVAIGHEMLYSTHDSSHVAQARTNREGPPQFHGALGLEPLFKNYSVDLYFSGHEHVYEHFARVYDSHVCRRQDVADSHCGLPPPCPCTAHIVVGNAGDREFPYMKNGTVMPFQYPQPTWEHFRATSPAGFGLLEVNESTMVWRQYNARTDEVIDEHTYTR
jgi:hypothetical protein